MRLAIANDMKKIRENITASHHEREKTIEDMRENVGDMLKSFQMSHKQMGVDLRISLKEFNNTRIEISNTFMGEMVTHIRDLRNDVMKRLEDYGSDMAEAKNIWVSLTGPESMEQRFIAPKREAAVKISTPIEKAAKEPPPVEKVAKVSTQAKKAIKEPTTAGEAIKGRNPKLRTRRKTQT